MGVEHYLVDVERKAVLGMHKSYWLPVGDAVGVVELIEAYNENPEARCRAPRVLGRAVSWMIAHTGGRVEIWTDHNDPLPWRTEDRHGRTRPNPEWMGHDAFHPPEEGWKLWGHEVDHP